MVIGPRWLAELSRRTAGEDQVRYEIAQALKHGKITVPVTVDHAELPDRASLPEDIAALSDAQGYELGVDVMWRPTVGKLIDDLSDFFAGRPGADLHGSGSVTAVDAVHAAAVPDSAGRPVRPHEPVSGTGHSRFGQPLLIGLAVLAVVLIGLVAWRVLAPPAPIIPPIIPPTSSTAPGAGSPPKPVARGTVVGTCDEGGTCGVRLRTAPADDAPTFPGELLKDGAGVQIVCQTIGDKSNNLGQVSTDFWYQLDSGAFISAVYVTIDASGRIPDCRP